MCNIIWQDYFVLLPAAYYEGSILTMNVTTPCLIQDNEGLCVHYSYPDVESRYAFIPASGGFVIGENNEEASVETYDNPDVSDSKI